LDKVDWRGAKVKMLAMGNQRLKIDAKSCLAKGSKTQRRPCREVDALRRKVMPQRRHSPFPPSGFGVSEIADTCQGWRPRIAYPVRLFPFHGEISAKWIRPSKER
jgi:hypothetical protein